MQDKIAYQQLAHCIQKMKETKWKMKGGRDTQALRDERSRTLLSTVLEQWRNQCLLRAVSTWMAAWWGDMFPSKPILVGHKSYKTHDSDMAAGLSLTKCPAVFLNHAEDQRRRLGQEQIALSTKGGYKSFEIFENQLKAQVRKDAHVIWNTNANGRAAQGDYRRLHIEPAPIYISIWHPADRCRAFKRMKANRARQLYEKAKWVVVETGGPAGVYYYHKDNNEMKWDPPTDADCAEMDMLLEKAQELERVAGFTVEEEAVDRWAGEVFTTENYAESYEGPD